LKNLFNNFSNQHLTLVISVLVVLISVVISVGISLINETFWGRPYSTLIFIVSVIVGFLICFIAVRYMLERYIFSKIKVIYKFINTSEDSEVKEGNVSHGLQQLDLVNEEVAEWAAGKEGLPSVS